MPSDNYCTNYVPNSHYLKLSEWQLCLKPLEQVDGRWRCPTHGFDVAPEERPKHATTRQDATE